VAGAEIAIVGAGPAGLTAAVELVCRRPDLAERLVVIDPSGRWLDQWDRQLAGQEVPHLRSPIVHHPHPDPWALVEFARRRRSEIAMDQSMDLPGTRLFRDFCAWVIEEHGLRDVVIAGDVRAVASAGAGLGATVELADGRFVRASSAVILAVNPRTKNLPDWVQQLRAHGPSPTRPRSPLADLVRHASEFDVAAVLDGGATLPRSVAIVGGGLTAAQLANSAAQRGVRVDLIVRRQLKVRQFDVEPGWIGPRELGDFVKEPDYRRRKRMIDAARDGGTVPPFAHRALARLVEEGAVRLHEHDEVVEIDRRAQRPGHTGPAESGCEGSLSLSLSTGASVAVDQVWLATGAPVDVLAHPAFATLASHNPTTIVDGLPVLEPSLRWPGTEVFVVGSATALEIGPACSILHGQRRAAVRIVSAITGLRPTLGFVHECDRPVVDELLGRATPTRGRGTRATSSRATSSRAKASEGEPSDVGRVITASGRSK